MLLVALTGTRPLYGISVRFDFDAVKPGDPAPAGDPAWVSALFESVDAQTVRLTLDTANLEQGEFLTRLWLNFNPAKDLRELGFAWVSGQAADRIVAEANRQNGSGLGKFDLQFSYPESNRDDRFLADELSVYNLTYGGAEGLSPRDFAVWSGGESGAGALAVAHVQGLPRGASAKIFPTDVEEVPENSVQVAEGGVTMVLLGGAIVGLAWFARRAEARNAPR